MFQSSHFVLAKSDLGMWSSVLASVVDGVLDADTFVINQGGKTFIFSMGGIRSLRFSLVAPWCSDCFVW